MFKAYHILHVLPSLTFKNSAWLLHCIYVFCMDHRTNSTFCLIHHLRLVFITELESFYCTVEPESLNNTDMFHP